MADQEQLSQEDAPSSLAHVSFGSTMRINPGVRLKRFDNGPAKAYQAYDAKDKTKKYIALVAGVECLPRWSVSNLYDKLSDTSFMRLMGTGIINWPLDGDQKCVFIYSGGLGDPLVEKGGFCDVHWRHPDIVDRFIYPMARMLKEMEEKSFSHGSIRPNNIFHGSIEKNTHIVLGDCLSVQPGSTQPTIFLPIEKAMAEPMGRGRGSIKDDIYAFGVSIVFFLRKQDEFSAIGDEELLKRRIENGTYATLIGNERFQASFLELLRGLLHDDPELRWTLEDIFAWLDGTRMSPAPHTRPKKASRSIVFGGKKYIYPQVLAMDVHNFPHEVAESIESGAFGQWVEKSVEDSSLTERYLKVLERIAGAGDVRDNKDYMVAQLRLALYPSLPIYYKGRTFTYDGLGALMAYDIIHDRDIAVFRTALRLNIPDQAAVLKNTSQNGLIQILKTFDMCRGSLQNTRLGYGIERCIYMLCRDAPCLSEKLKGYFVNGHRSGLYTYEKICSSGKEIALLLDRHSVAFFSVLDGSLVERALYDLNEPDKDIQILGNLRFFSTMQERSKGMDAYALASVFMNSMSGIYNSYHNKALKKKIQEGVEEAAKEGDLITMSAILDDDKVLQRDSLAFKRAQLEYSQLQNEYNEYNRRLANKETYGITNGRDAAAIVSWTIATIITMMVVFAHLSGYRMY